MRVLFQHPSSLALPHPYTSSRQRITHAIALTPAYPCALTFNAILSCTFTYRYTNAKTCTFTHCIDHLSLTVIFAIFSHASLTPTPKQRPKTFIKHPHRQTTFNTFTRTYPSSHNHPSPYIHICPVAAHCLPCSPVTYVICTCACPDKILTCTWQDTHIYSCTPTTTPPVHPPTAYTLDRRGKSFH